MGDFLSSCTGRSTPVCALSFPTPPHLLRTFFQCRDSRWRPREHLKISIVLVGKNYRFLLQCLGHPAFPWFQDFLYPLWVELWGTKSKIWFRTWSRKTHRPPFTPPVHVHVGWSFYLGQVWNSPVASMLHTVYSDSPHGSSKVPCTECVSRVHHAEG